jgi:hypothetical protein
MAHRHTRSDHSALEETPPRLFWLPASWSLAFALSAVAATTAPGSQAQAQTTQSATPTAPASGSAKSDPADPSYPILLLRSEESYADYRPPEGAGLPYVWKHIPLSDEGYAPGAPYLSVGGEARYRVDAFNKPLFGLTNGDSFTSHQTRFLLHADWRPDPAWRVFVQLGASDETGRKPRERAFDESEPDIAQAFVDYRIGGEDGWRLRAGRQELTFGRYITLRDGTNLRRTFDGVRLTGPVPLVGGTLDGFTASLTEQKEGLFDDVPDDQDTSSGAIYNRPIGEHSRFILTYFNRENERGSFAAGTGVEQRQSVAMRFQTNRGPFAFDGQFSVQSGTLDRPGDPDLEIGAYGFATETSYLFRDARLSPRVAVRIDGASGDEDAGDDKLGTFDLAYPDLTYLSDLTAFAARNLWQVQPFVTIEPTQALSLTAGVGFLWRMEQGDSVYAPTSLRLTAIDAPGGAYVSAQTYLRAIWRMNQFVELSSSLVHADAAGVLKEAGLKDQSLAAFQLLTRF